MQEVFMRIKITIRATNEYIDKLSSSELLIANQCTVNDLYEVLKDDFGLKDIEMDFTFIDNFEENHNTEDESR